LIAVIDDDEAVRVSLKFMLEIEGFVAHTFSTPGEFLDTKDAGSYLCVIADQVMPEMTGLALIGELRRRGNNAPAILIVSNPTPAVRGLATDAGVLIIEKPLLENTLGETLHDILTDATAAPGV
jgi:FixJ family two-component response regulator